MPDTQRTLPAASAWHTQLIRLTAFPVDAGSVDESTWWQELTGGEPEDEVRKKLHRQYDGAFQDVPLQLTVDPVRIQWSRFARIDPLNPPDEFPNIGSFPAVAESFSTLMQRWLSTAPPLKRLAFGTVLFQPVADRASGYRRLDDYLPFVEVTPGGHAAPETTDFMFKINRPRLSTSGVPDLKINRLMTWSFIHWNLAVEVSHAGGEPQPLPPASGYACRLELDISSSGESKAAIAHQDLIPLWQELFDLAGEITVGGDKT